MHGVGYAAALVLAAVFAVAGMAKLGDRAGTRTTFVALGLPEPAAAAVPAFELGIAIGLVVTPGWAAVVALALLAAFTTFLVRAVRSGVTVGCNCFGSARHAPVSAVELFRNTLLAIAGAVALSATGPTVPDASAIAVTVLAVAGGITSLRLADRRRRRRAEGPTLGALAPPLDGVRWEDAPRTIVAFLSPGCARCDHERPELERSVARVRVLELDDMTRGTFATWGVRATPYYVVVDASGTVRTRGERLPRRV
jgi:hypothetical protein